MSPQDAPPDGAGPGAARATILLVEDNVDNRCIYETYLTHVGYAVLAVEDAEAGLALVHVRRPDLIVMDVGLPGMDGYEATRRLKADPATRRIPIVVLTAHAHADDRARALDAGCDRFLTKPLDPRALGGEVERMLDGAAPDARPDDYDAFRRRSSP
jgi:CheY-like chemotaxis protein